MEWRAFLVSVTSNKRVMELLDGRNVLGRGRVLHVDDITCSRSQVEIHVDRPNQRLTIKRLGVNSSSIQHADKPLQEAEILPQHEAVPLVAGDTVFLRGLEHPFLVEVECADSREDAAAAARMAQQVERLPRAAISFEEGDTALELNATKPTSLRHSSAGESVTPHDTPLVFAGDGCSSSKMAPPKERPVEPASPEANVTPPIKPELPATPKSQSHNHNNDNSSSSSSSGAAVLIDISTPSPSSRPSAVPIECVMQLAAIEVPDGVVSPPRRRNLGSSSTRFKQGIEAATIERRTTRSTKASRTKSDAINRTVSFRELLQQSRPPTSTPASSGSTSSGSASSGSSSSSPCSSPKQQSDCSSSMSASSGSPPPPSLEDEDSTPALLIRAATGSRMSGQKRKRSDITVVPSMPANGSNDDDDDDEDFQPQALSSNTKRRRLRSTSPKRVTFDVSSSADSSELSSASSSMTMRRSLLAELEYDSEDDENQGDCSGSSSRVPALPTTNSSSSSQRATTGSACASAASSSSSSRSSQLMQSPPPSDRLPERRHLLRTPSSASSSASASPSRQDESPIIHSTVVRVPPDKPLGVKEDSPSRLSLGSDTSDAGPAADSNVLDLIAQFKHPLKRDADDTDNDDDDECSPIMGSPRALQLQHRAERSVPTVPAQAHQHQQQLLSSCSSSASVFSASTLEYDQHQHASQSSSSTSPTQSSSAMSFLLSGSPPRTTGTAIRSPIAHAISTTSGDLAATDAERPTDCGTWKRRGTLLYNAPAAVAGSSAIVAFDLDGTLITTKSGASFPRSRSDWTWLSTQVPRRLRQLRDQRVKVVVFSNQRGISDNPTKLYAITGKITDMMQVLGMSFQVFIATATDVYRKPAIGMWEFMCQNCNDGIAPQLSRCVYVGDFGGRVENWRPGKKADKEATDRKFAHNIGIEYQTPEQYFLGDTTVAPFSWRSLNPANVPSSGMVWSSTVSGESGASGELLVTGEREILVFVGPPAAGKSTFAHRFLVTNGYAYVNQDTIKSRSKCVKACQEALARGQSVVIDNTNASQATRASYVALAKAAGIPCRCVWFQTSPQLAAHLNIFREKQTRGKRKRLPAIAFENYATTFNEPQLQEGFTDIIKVHFVAHFASPQQRQLFLQYT